MAKNVRIGARNQVTIPKEIMESLVLKPKDYLQVSIKYPNFIVMRKVEN
jgi:AbrB family looped-hinge helix DNA binding protein